MKLLLFLLLTTFAPAAEIQNAYSIGPEGITLTAISSPSAVFQFGVGTTWCATTFSNPKLPLLISWSSPNTVICPTDPAPGIVKTLVAQQQATAYTVTYTQGGKTTVVTVPALPLPVTPTPTASPAPGTFTVAQTVTLSDTTSGASIFYSLTGTATCSATPYTVPIPIVASTTLSAIACKTGNTNSALLTAVYTINIPASTTYTVTNCNVPTSGTLTVLSGSTTGTYTGTGTFSCTAIKQ